MNSDEALRLRGAEARLRTEGGVEMEREGGPQTRRSASTTATGVERVGRGWMACKMCRYRSVALLLTDTQCRR